MPSVSKHPEEDDIVVCIYDQQYFCSRLGYSVRGVDNESGETQWGEVHELDTGKSPSVAKICKDSAIE